MGRRNEQHIQVRRTGSPLVLPDGMARTNAVNNGFDAGREHGVGPCPHDRAAARRAVQRRVDAQVAGSLVQPGNGEARGDGRVLPTVLTERQLEVAVLIAAGRTNREIAEALVLSEGTVTNHVERILRRLGLRNRVQVAAWAIEHGLVPPLSNQSAAGAPAPSEALRRREN